MLKKHKEMERIVAEGYSDLLTQFSPLIKELRALRSIMGQLGYKYWETDEGWRYSKNA